MEPMACAVLLLHMQESPLIEYYYHLLEPGVHYEPFYVNGPNDLLQEVRGIYGFPTC